MDYKLLKEQISLIKGNNKEFLKKIVCLSNIRPNIAYALGIVSRFIHFLQFQHMEVAMRIIRYLNGTSKREILFKRNGK